MECGREAAAFTANNTQATFKMPGTMNAGDLMR
jgi:hypothetical protein